MITPTAATITMIGLAIFLLIIIPILDSHKTLGKYISLRYTLVTVFVITGIGCVLDFSHLVESSRNIVLMGSSVLVGIFVVVRTLEKTKLGSKINLKAKKGDAEVSAEIDPKDNKEQNNYGKT